MFIYLCYAIPASDAAHNIAVSNPGNRQSLLLIEIFKEVFKEELIVLTIPPRKASFKDRKKKRVLNGKDILPNVMTKEIEYYNFPYLKYRSISKSVYRELKSLLMKYENCTIMTVNSNSYISKPLFKLKKKFNFKTSIYFSDMPFNLNKTRNIFSLIFNKIDNYYRNKYLYYYDSCIGSIDRINEIYFKNKPVIRIEPALDFTKYKEYSNNSAPNKPYKIVYTGSLNDNYHIKEILNAFTLLPPYYELFIYGKGKYEKLAKKFSNKYTNINFGGFLPFEEIAKIQCNSDILLSLMNSKLKISKYAVPSKVFDYLCTGVPIISTNVESLIDEVKPYLTFVKTEKGADIADSIKMVLEDSEIYRKKKILSLEGREYVLHECSWEHQKKKIKHFLGEITCAKEN